ncbi:hypothetical protein [Flaviflagellibacter deserti]|uniref:Uncharacterized protein n=1 Tax=Flaviflagellibacter deserti TaxID=2267266 RepID=A0ABV9Z0X6_9HYPH
MDKGKRWDVAKPARDLRGDLPVIYITGDGGGGREGSGTTAS